jgi:hypothetical protein
MKIINEFYNCCLAISAIFKYICKRKYPDRLFFVTRISCQHLEFSRKDYLLRFILAIVSCGIRIERLFLEVFHLTVPLAQKILRCSRLSFKKAAHCKRTA